MPDAEIPCIQCKEIFVFSEKEQEIYYQRNMMTPQRCPECRGKKKGKKVLEESGRFEIVCDHCGKHDTVPFQPKVGRSVFCKECHQASRSKAKAS